MTRPLYKTGLGQAYCEDSVEFMKSLPPSSVDLVMTSPPFALQRQKKYGNVPPEQYVMWFMPFASEITRVLRPKGSFVLDIAGSWVKGQPTRSLYHYRLLLALCHPEGPYHLAQEFYWYNPAKMPAPAQWVTIERVRVKDSVNPIWWLSKSPRPAASNKWVLTPYSESMKALLSRGYNQGARPSGHVVSASWGRRNKGAIPPNMIIPNVIIASNTRSKDGYLEACREHGLEPNPARFVDAVPEFFIRFLTKPGDVVMDPFAGSNIVGHVAERLGRRWISSEINEEYAVGSAFRFPTVGPRTYRKWARRKQRKER